VTNSQIGPYSTRTYGVCVKHGLADLNLGRTRGDERQTGTVRMHIRDVDWDPNIIRVDYLGDERGGDLRYLRVPDLTE